MLKSLMATAAICLATFPHAASAGEDGNELLTQCNLVIQFLDGGRTEPVEPANALDAGHCLGFVEATTNLMYFYQLTDRKSALFCTPEGGISNGQAARILVKYLREHPQDLHQPKAVLAAAAFRDAYPCNER